MLLAATATTLVFVGDASSRTAPKKLTLTIVVHGGGGVVSRPAGIRCPDVCKLHVRKGAHVLLMAIPHSGNAFGGWGNGCATAATPHCTLTVTRSQAVGVTFRAPPPPPPTTTTTPPPPPPAVAGHYSGTYSDGTFITFDVLPSGISVGNFDFDFNGECGDYGTSSGESAGPGGPFAIQPDGSFQGTGTFSPTNATGTITVGGTFAQDGSGSGTVSITFTFTSGDAQGQTCNSHGTWTAHVQS